MSPGKGHLFRPTRRKTRTRNLAESSKQCPTPEKVLITSSIPATSSSSQKHLMSRKRGVTFPFFAFISRSYDPEGAPHASLLANRGIRGISLLTPRTSAFQVSFLELSIPSGPFHLSRDVRTISLIPRPWNQHRDGRIREMKQNSSLFLFALAC